MKSSHAQLSLEKKIENFEPLIVTNDTTTFIRPKGHPAPAILDRQLFIQQCPVAVIDRESLKMIQVLQLHRAIDQTKSSTGSAVLLRSLIQPSTNLQFIRSRQEALGEIASNDQLRRALQDCVHEFSNGEGALYKFFNKGLYALFPYMDLKSAKQAAVKITQIMQTLPGSESAYLKTLLSQLYSYQGSSIDRMMNGSIYQTFSGLKSDKEIGILTPSLKFTPRRFSRWMLAGPAVALAPHILDKVGIEHAISPLLTSIGIGWTGLSAFYAMFIKPVRDTGKFIEPFRAKCIRDNAFSRAIDTMGMIDELLSLHKFASELPHATELPKITDQDHHCFEATGLKNPVLATRDKTDFVPNNVSMNGTRLTFISGPNSGGKTTICKSIVHNQLLAQMGSYVLAEKATINIADMISYQAPKFDGLQDEEGRFGTELARTRDIFYSTSPKSLVILDELAEGTTYEERLHESYGILSDFHTIGNNTVLVTHNHSLVDRFMEAQKGQSIMFEFKGDDPTYRIVPGISRVSHADRIAKKINFSKADRSRYMKARGYV